MNENIEKSIFSGINSTTSTTSFYMNSTGTTDHKRDTVTISVEEFEDLIEYKKICQSLFKEFKEELL